MTTLFTTAYTGSGKIDEELVAHHLDQLLPENLGMVYIPDGEIPRRKLPGLTSVVEWLTKEVGTEGTIPVSDLVATLVKRRDENGDDVALVTVHDPDSEADVALAKAAHEAGIRVIDLTKAANDMIFEDEPEGGEPEGLEDGPPWEGDEPSPAEAAADAAEKELGLTEEREAAAARHAERTESPGEAVERARAAGVAAAQSLRASLPQDAAPPLTLTIHFPLEQGFVDALAFAIVKAMGNQAQATVEQAGLTIVPTGEGVAPVIPIGTTGIATSDDPAGQPPDTSVYYYNAEKATYRPARGKARADESRVFLTKEDVAEARAKGMLG